MQILECWLKHYGMFSDTRLTFHAGLNIIEGGNESGKSTVVSFIRAMLYGLPKTRSRGIDEYRLRQPWENPDYFAGVMRVHDQDRIYRIERNFLKKDEKLTVVCETEGRELDSPELLLDRLTGGLSEAEFVNTVCIRQSEAATDARLGEALRDCLVNVEQSGNPQTDVASALEALKTRQKELEAEQKKSLDEISGRMEENRREAEYVRSEIGRLRQRMAESAGKALEDASYERRAVPDAAETAGQQSPGQEKLYAGEAANPARCSEADAVNEAARHTSGPDRLRQASPDERLYRILMALLPAAAALSAVCAVLVRNVKLRVALLVFAAAAAGAGVLLWKREKGYGERTCGTLAGRAEAGEGSARTALTESGGSGAGRRKRSSDSPAADNEDENTRGLRRAERSVRRYSRWNRLLGFRDNSFDPEFEARRRRLDEQKEKAVQAEQDRSRRMAAEDVARILREKDGAAARTDRLGEIPEVRGKERTENAKADCAGSRSMSGNLLDERRSMSESLRTGNMSLADNAPGDTQRSFGRAEAFRQELSEKQRQLSELDAAFENLAAEKDRAGKTGPDLDAVRLAQKRIRELSSEIYRESGAHFSGRVSELLSRMTSGRYSSISMDERMEVCVNTPDRLLKISQVSRGTMDQIYFALRIAAGELLSGGADLPLLLDEPFALYDDGRLKDAMRFLTGYGRQVLLFTCQGREKAAAAEISAEG